jgi:alpha,alpha-trehalase
MKPVTIDPRYHDAVIFDLDGVVANTRALRAAACKRAFDDYLSGRAANGNEDCSPFTEEDYHRYVDGKSAHDGFAEFLAS